MLFSLSIKSIVSNIKLDVSYVLLWFHTNHGSHFLKEAIKLLKAKVS